MSDSQIFQFGEFTLNAARRELTRAGVSVDIGSRALDLLVALVCRHGVDVSKSKLISIVWPDQIVEENNLTTQISNVRRALGETTSNIFIRTVPSRGYRFVAEVIDASSTHPAGSPDNQPQIQTSKSEPALAVTPLPAPPPLPRHNLPIESSSFIGRGAELAELRARLARRAVVSIVGPGGVGKTRAAIRLAQSMLEDFADGVLLLELAPLTGPGIVAEAACRLLGVPASGDRPAADMAVSVLRNRHMLLVLDNCEHVLAGAADFAAAIIRNCPHIKILATTQEALGLPGEWTFPMPTLAVPQANGLITAAVALECDAVRLFVDRAADALGSYALTDEDAPYVATICRRLDGVPLATELAAARLRMLNAAEIAERLENVFRLLTSGSRVALPRHQTLRATIEWSFSLLSVAEQVVLRRLCVFIDGCTLSGAAAVAAGTLIDQDEIFDLVSALVTKSLIIADTSGRSTRYRMLESTRQFAAEKLADAGEEGCRRAMAEFLLGVYRRAEAAWPLQSTAAWLAAYAPEAENLRAAIDWAFSPAGDPALGVSMVAHSGPVVDELSLQSDLRRWTEAAQPHIGPATPRGEAAAIAYLRTVLQRRLGVHEVPEERADAIALFREAGDAVGLSRALRQTAIARAMPGQGAEQARIMLTEAVALLRDRAPHKDLATALAHTGSVHFLNGELAQARNLNEEALAMRQSLGDSTGVLASSVNLAELLFLTGDSDGALSYAMQAAAEARRRKHLATLALILTNLAGYQLRSGNVAGARATARESLALHRATGQDYFAVICLEHTALALALQGLPERAAGLRGYCEHYYAVTGQVREPLEQVGYDLLVARLAEALPEPLLSSLIAAGDRWSAEIADHTALG